MQNTTRGVSNGNQVGSGGWIKQFGNWPVDAPSQLHCIDCIAEIVLYEVEAHVVDHDEPVVDAANDSGDGVKASIGHPLPDMSDALVNNWVKVAASEALGVNQHTMVVCQESR